MGGFNIIGNGMADDSMAMQGAKAFCKILVIDQTVKGTKLCL